MKIPAKFIFCGVLGLQALAFGQTQTISGRVIDSITSNPIPSATVRLKNLGLETYTDALGQFSFTFTPSGTRQPVEEAGHSTAMHLMGTKFSFVSASKELVRIELFDIRGQRISTLLNRSFDAGEHSIPLPGLIRKNIGSGLYILKIKKGEEVVSGAFLPMGAGSGVTANNSTSFYAGNGTWALAKLASLDSLPAKRAGYTSKTLPITSYTTQNVGDIRLYQTAEERAIAKKVDSLLALMTIAEKAGQMTQIRKSAGVSNTNIASLGIGSVFNGGGDTASPNTPAGWATLIDAYQDAVASLGPHKIPIIYGQDCVHGMGTVRGSTVFPHNIGLGCTGDTALISKMGQVVASEAAACGIRLNFAPCVASARNERWGRTYEGFGETPEINALMGAAYTRGLQGCGDPSKDTAMVAGPKHYMGDGGTTDGANAATTTLADSSMRYIHFSQYLACVREQMGSTMPSYTTWARPGGPSFKMTLDSIAYRMLKKDGGFDGFCVSDWDAVNTACGYNNSCIAQCINAGLDMAMIVNSGDMTTWLNAIQTQAGTAALPMSRVDDAVKRILRIKFRFHIFDHPKHSAAAQAQFNSAAHKAIARALVRESLVLLKNDNSALPLTTSQKIVVVGPYANDIGVQCGGWTISWQGQSGNGYGIAGQTILAGMQSVGTSANITNNGSSTTIPAGTDRIVVVVGETPYAEGTGDRIAANLDLTNINNAGTPISQCWANRGTARVIVVLLSGRPLLIDTELPQCDAFVAAWLPGGEGAGVADVLYSAGGVKPTGKLTHSWPASAAQIPINVNLNGKTYNEEQKGSGGTPAFAYGFGLTYP